MADINSSLPIRTETDGDVVIKIVDSAGSNVASVDANGDVGVILAANSGVDIGDVDVISIIPGTGATNLGKAEDAAHTTGDVGVMTLAVRQDTQTDFGADGDYVPLSINADGELRVTSSASTGVTHTDDAAFTVATDDGVPAFAMFDDSTPDSVDEGDAGILRMSANRNLYTTLRDAAGNERGVNVNASNELNVEATNAGTFAVQVDGDALTALQLIDDIVYAEDASHTSTDKGAFVLAVRNDTLAALGGTDGDYAPIQVNALGAVYAEAVQTTHDTLNANVNIQVADTDVGEANPVPVYVTGAVATNEVNDYDTAAAVAAAATDNHDYTVTGSSTLLLKQITASASGLMRVALSIGPVAALVAKGVWFNSTANPNIDVTFAQPMEVPDTSTGTVRLARTNLEASAQDVYSTILGSEV